MWIPEGNTKIASAVPQILVADKQLIAIFLRRGDRPVSVSVVSGFGKRGKGGERGVRLLSSGHDDRGGWSGCLGGSG